MCLYNVRLAIECKVKSFKYIQIFSENTNSSSSALGAYVQYLRNTLVVFLVRLYAIYFVCYTCLQMDILWIEYMRSGNVWLTQWMSFGTVKFIFFGLKYCICLALLLNFFSISVFQNRFVSSVVNVCGASGMYTQISSFKFLRLKRFTVALFNCSLNIWAIKNMWVTSLKYLYISQLLQSAYSVR